MLAKFGNNPDMKCKSNSGSLGPFNIGCESSTLGKVYGIKCGDIGSLEKTSGIGGMELVENTLGTHLEHHK
jgi:hypothetical protein